MIPSGPPGCSTGLLSADMVDIVIAWTLRSILVDQRSTICVSTRSNCNNIYFLHIPTFPTSPQPHMNVTFWDGHDIISVVMWGLASEYYLQFIPALPNTVFIFQLKSTVDGQVVDDISHDCPNITIEDRGKS